MIFLERRKEREEILAFYDVMPNDLLGCFYYFIQKQIEKGLFVQGNE